jgi:hydrogenase nickel incorporation protein HypA/HybF
MHETAIVRELISSAESEMSRAGARGRARRVEVVIGRLSGASPEAVRFAFECLSPGTRLEGSRLDIREVAPVCRCAACGAANQIDDIFAACPACGSLDVSIEGGRDLVLQSIEVEA